MPYDEVPPDGTTSPPPPEPIGDPILWPVPVVVAVLVVALFGMWRLRSGSARRSLAPSRTPALGETPAPEVQAEVKRCAAAFLEQSRAYAVWSALQRSDFDADTRDEIAARHGSVRVHPTFRVADAGGLRSATHVEPACRQILEDMGGTWAPDEPAVRQLERLLLDDAREYALQVLADAEVGKS